MNRLEARNLVDDALASLRTDPHPSLVERYLDNHQDRQVIGRSGTVYQVEVDPFWDDGKPGNLRVSVGIDDGGWRAFVPMTAGFIMAADGSYVAE